MPNRLVIKDFSPIRLGLRQWVCLLTEDLLLTEVCLFRRGRRLSTVSSLSLILFAGMNPIPASDKPLLRLGPVLGLSGGCIMIVC